MLKRLVNFAWEVCKRDSFQRFKPVADALDTFCYEPINPASSPPFIRDAVDVKRWMMLVVIALTPPTLMAVWNSGLQACIYSSGHPELMRAFLNVATFRGYFSFIVQHVGILTILLQGCKIFLPLLCISYTVGGICEVLFAVVRKQKIAEGLLVTGILYPLTLPPTIPYWMAALGIAFGVIISKELFGGTGMNILNPALSGRAFLFFTFPEKMSGDVWVGSNPTAIKDSLMAMSNIDGFSQATCLQVLNATPITVKRVHIDAIASNILQIANSPSQDVLQSQFSLWAELHPGLTLENLSLAQLRDFLSAPVLEGGLGLLPTQFDAAYSVADVIYGIGKFSSGNLFWGNVLGSLGETSVVASLLGAIFLIITGVASWRTMVSFGIGAFVSAWLFKAISILCVGDHGAWAPAKFFIPAHRHLFLGGLAFGLVFMATDPVSSPAMKLAKWFYGLFVGFVTILIRLVNPAYPEGVMLAILLGNVFSPLFDYIVVRKFVHRSLN